MRTQLSSCSRSGAPSRRSGCADNFRLCRGRLAALGSDSAYDHEILHTYSLSGIIMRGCHALSRHVSESAFVPVGGCSDRSFACGLDSPS
jgi:hypothetical protein